MATNSDDQSTWGWVKSNIPTMLAVGGIMASAIAFGYGQALRLVQIELLIDQNRSNVVSLTVDMLTDKVIELTSAIRGLEARSDDLTIEERDYLTKLYQQRRILERRLSEVGQ